MYMRIRHMHELISVLLKFCLQLHHQPGWPQEERRPLLQHCVKIAIVLKSHLPSQTWGTRWLRLYSAATGVFNYLRPGDYVLVKDRRWKNWKVSRWQGPFQMLLVTQGAIKVAERAYESPREPLQVGHWREADKSVAREGERWLAKSPCTGIDAKVFAGPGTSEWWIETLHSKESRKMERAAPWHSFRQSRLCCLWGMVFVLRKSLVSVVLRF